MGYKWMLTSNGKSFTIDAKTCEFERPEAPYITH